MRGELVDTRNDPHVLAARRRARLVRLAFPFLTSILLIAAIVAITIYTERINRRDALELTSGIISAVQNSVRREVEAFLAPPSAAIAALADGHLETVVTGRPEADRRLERSLRRVLFREPALAAAFVGDAEGDFVMVQRQEGQLRTKLITASGDERVVRWIERGRGGAVVSERFEADDLFDPSVRPWFQSAQAHAALQWSDVYRFFTTGALGVTVSMRVPGVAGPAATVVGADLELSAIGDFLATLDLGADGRALIIEPNGDVIAFPPSLVPTDTAAAPTVASFADPVVNEAFQRFRIERDHQSVVVIDGRRYLVSATSLADLVDRDWWVLLVVPEANFVGFVAANARLSLALSGLVVFLASAVGALLTWQGVQSDARARRALRSEAIAAGRDRMLDRLAAIRGLVDPNDDEGLRRFAAIVTEATGARRAAIWRLDAAGDAFVCLEAYDRDVNAHTAAATLRRDHLASVWPLLTAGERTRVSANEAPDGWQPLRELYLDVVGVDRLDIVPITRSGRLLGLLWLEDVAAGAAVIERDSAKALLANMLAPRLEALTAAERAGVANIRRREPSVLPPAVAHAAPLGAERRASISCERDRALLRRLAGKGGVDAVGAVLLPRVAVLHLQLGDGTGLALGGADGRTAGLGSVVADTQAAAQRLEIRYLKLVGDTIIAAAGFAADGSDMADEAAVRALAELALAIQPACRAASRGQDGRAAFRFGLDLGPAFGAGLGFGEVSFNLWGEPCAIAKRLAESAPATAIQVSEAAYDRLSADYLLRRRGSYYLDGVGEMSTFLLAGRL